MSKRRAKPMPGHKQLTTDAQPSVNHNPVMTLDAFQNALARLGFNMPNATEGASYPLTRLSQNYQLMNSLYRSHWIVRKIVDTIPEDMCKNWIKINTQLDPASIKQLEKTIRRTQTKEKILEGLKWGRLYGGAAGIILLEGQEDLLALPLDYNLVMPGSYKGLLILDRWSGISPGAQTVTDINSTEFGLPEYYQITTQDAKSFIVHHSRLLRFTGNTLPMWERMAEMQWGASVIESVYDELKKRDNTSWNIASLVFLANLRVFKSDMLGETLGLGGEEAQRDLYRTVEAQNHMMNNQSMMFMGTNDSLETHSYAFSGINDIYESFMLDVAGACEIPVTRLFGRAPAGMDATGESDMNNYYDTIEEKQEAYLSPVLDKLLPIIALSTWGAIPDDLDYVYNPLRKADPKENAELSKSISDSIIAVYTAGLISDRTALKELRQQTDVTGMWSNITDEDIAKADDSPDFGGDMPPMGGIMPNFNQPQQMMATDADFKEEDHPRAKNGQFGSGGGGEEAEPLKPEKEENKTTIKNNKSGKKGSKQRSQPIGLANLLQAYEEKNGPLEREVGTAKKPSALGPNKFNKGFGSENLDEHFTKHKREYPGMTKEEYAQRALELVQMPVGGNILGYQSKIGRIVRYDTTKNDLVSGHPGYGIATMNKLQGGESRFHSLKKRDE